MCRAQLHGSACAQAALPARADRTFEASTSKPASPAASQPASQKGGDAMQRLMRQRTAGGRVQMPPMPQSMAQVSSAPLSPNILAEPYRYELCLCHIFGRPLSVQAPRKWCHPVFSWPALCVLSHNVQMNGLVMCAMMRVALSV